MFCCLKYFHYHQFLLIQNNMAIQQVILQNFRAKKNTIMKNNSEITNDLFLRIIATTRIYSPSHISIQVPPNLSPDINLFLKSGINDLGGISPLTIDWVNPDHLWPNINKLKISLLDEYGSSKYCPGCGCQMKDVIGKYRVRHCSSVLSEGSANQCCLMNNNSWFECDRENSARLNMMNCVKEYLFNNSWPKHLKLKRGNSFDERIINIQNSTNMA